MKKNVVIIILFVLVAFGAYQLGTMQAENYVDMEQVTGFEAHGDGLQLYFEDDTGYYWGPSK